MGRIQTPQINFSLIDTNYTRKEYALKVRVKFGLLGHLVLYEVIGWINEGKGCYAEYTEDTAATFAMTRLGALEYAAKVDEIFRFMIEIGFFDKNAFLEDKILTSEGIVRRWMAAKRRPESYDFPASVKGIILSIRSEKPAADGPENGGPETGTDTQTDTGENEADPGFSATIPQNAPKSTETAPKSTENEHLSRQGEERRGEEYKYKQTNKLTKAIFAAKIEEAKTDQRWPGIRTRIARLIYEPGLSADLTDAITAAAVRRWINVPQLNAWLRKARDELEVSRRTDQRFGKRKRWPILRPWIAEVYLAHGITLPKCDPNRREPPPVPETAPEDPEQAKNAAGRAVIPK